jgi:hypothetical protein
MHIGLYSPTTPFTKTILALGKLSKCESPMQKLELIYNCCTKTIVEEISLFWQAHDIPPKKLAIDTDNLQGIVIFVVSRMNYP